MHYARDIFYLTALVLVIAAGCRTPLGNFNKQKAVVENIQKQEDANKEKQLDELFALSGTGKLHLAKHFSKEVALPKLNDVYRSVGGSL